MPCKCENDDSGFFSDYSPEQRAFLDKFYAEHGVETAEQKLTTIQEFLGGQWNISSAQGEVTLSLKVACMERDLLDRNGLGSGIEC